jgi:hypothetical protein
MGKPLAEQVKLISLMQRQWYTKDACTFLRQLFPLMHRSNYYIRLTTGAKADLAWWRCFLQSWNGSSFFPLPTPSYRVYFDASGSWGCGAITCGLGWFQISDSVAPGLARRRHLGKVTMCAFTQTIWL